MKNYIQTSFLADNADFVNPRSVSCVKCWRCQKFFSFSKIRFFDCMYPTGRVGNYQACEACYKVIMANRGCL